MKKITAGAAVSNGDWGPRRYFLRDTVADMVYIQRAFTGVLVKRLILLSAIFLCRVSHACYVPTHVKVSTNSLWFPVGERLTYDLYWGVIPVGEAVMESSWIEKDGKRLLSLVATAKSGRVLSGIYPLDDYIESVVDPTTFLPVKYVQRLHEGHHIRRDVVKFDYQHLLAHWRSDLTGRTNSFPILADTRDVVSLSYYMRSKNYSGKEHFTFRVLVDDKLYDLQINFNGEEDLKIDGHGSVPCFKLEPVASFGAIFVRKGKVNLWFSEDARHLCTRMAGKVPVASVKAILSNVTGDESAPWKPDAK